VKEKPTSEPKDYEARQQAHYDEIGEAYEAHYSDESSNLYRRRFLYEPLSMGIDLRGRKVLDAMCGSGQTAEYLLSRGALAYGLDISAQVIDQFRAKLPTAVGVQGSILNSEFADEAFDAVFVTGGLHHVHPKVPEAVTEIHRILKPGGWLCFDEPHTGSFADVVRRFWYRHDRLFEENEAAVDIEDLMRRNAQRFDFVTTRYSGGPAYLLVLNSMVFRVPLAWKARYTRPLLWIERQLERVQGKRTSCFVLVQWRKRAA
jgi:SAM-dependent methyltransferase